MIRVGPAGWDYADWEGVVYPSPRPRKLDRLRFIADYFDAVELNVTFYRQPERRQVASWARRVEDYPEFRFTAKLYRQLTHFERAAADGRFVRRGPAAPEPAGRSRAALADLRAAAASYREGLEPLTTSGRLLAVLMQFPQSFDNQPAHSDHLECLAELLEGLPLVAELRHESWDRPEVLALLRRLRIGFCNIDQPSLRGTLGPTDHVTSRVAYVRLHGRNTRNWFRRDARPFERYDYLYAMEELEPWIGRVEELARHAEQVVIIANNHYRGKGPANALMIKSSLSRGRVRAPSSLAGAFAALEGRVVTERGTPRQGRLF